ncbi:MAG: hypothetical protein WD751_01445 [Anaerolineales bacterium]
MDQNAPEKRRKLLKGQVSRSALASLALLAFLAACNPVALPTADGPPTATSTPTRPPTDAPTPTESVPQQFSLDSLTFSTNQEENQKIRTELESQRLESSIKLAQDGYHTSFTRWENEQPVTEDILINPSSLTIDINNKNAYGKTPTIETEDGQTLLWSQEHNNWFAQVEIQKDNIMEPVYVPFGYQDVLLRSLLLDSEISKPFPEGTRFEGLRMQFAYAENGEKYILLRTTSELDPDITADKLGVQWTNTWFYTKLSDGTLYQYTPTKWLDPADPNNPQMDEFKFIFGSFGQEILGYENPNNDLRKDEIPRYLNVVDNSPVTVPHPIITASEDFFNNGTNVSDIFPGLAGKIFVQPSLARLYEQEGNKLENLRDPNYPGFTFAWIDQRLADLSPENPLIEAGLTIDNPDYKTNFLPPEIQIMILPLAFGGWTGSPRILPTVIP